MLAPSRLSLLSPRSPLSAENFIFLFPHEVLMDSSGSLHCLGGADGGGGGPGKNSTASQPSSSAVTAGPGSSSLSASASAFPSSPLSASGPNAKKRGRSGNAGKPAGGGGGSTAECGRLAEAMRLLQSGKLPKLDPSEERVKEEYEK